MTEPTQIRWVWWPRAVVQHAVRGLWGTVAVCGQGWWLAEESDNTHYPRCKRCLRKLGGRS
jgi:hypothetical protein